MDHPHLIRRTSHPLLILPCLLVVLMAAAGTAQAQLTTLYSNLEGPRTVTGIDSHPVGPSDLGTFRIATQFSPTVSGKAQLLSIRGRCLVPFPEGIACANVGQVSLHADAGGRPASAPLGTMGYYLLQDSESSWRIKITGNPTGGSFRITQTVDGATRTSEPISYDAFHYRRNWNPAGQDMDDSLFNAGIRSTALTQGRFPDDTGLLRVEGTLTATDVRLTGGDHPSISVTQPMIEEECGTLSPAPDLVAGRKYWAVMTSEDGVGWDDWTNNTGEVLESVDGGAWSTAFSTKMPALRIDGGADTCQAVAEPNPASGTNLGEMIVRPGGKAWTTITMSNRGVAPMTLGSATFAGAGGEAFSLMDGAPGPLARPARLKPVGIDGTSIFYPTCNGDAPEDWYRSTLVLETSDPQQPEVRYPISCLVDGTPPRIDFGDLRPNGRLDWFTAPARGSVRVDDPESDHMVDGIRCSRAGQAFDGPGRFAAVNLTVEGDLPLECTSTDIAGNTATVQRAIKVDTRRPVLRADVAPRPNADGWSNAPQVTVSFDCTDPAPGSGVAGGTAPGGTVTEETTGAVFESGCTDVAGLTADRARVEVKIDRTAPAITAGVVPAPNAAGWNRTDATVAFACDDRGTVRSGIKTDTVADAVMRGETDGTTVTSSGRCADRAGNEAPAVSRSVKLDKTEPSTELAGGPSGATGVTTADFELRGSDVLSGLARLECRLDGAAFVACTSPMRLNGLADGDHSFSVRAVDAAGNVDGTPATRSWTVDTVPPETRVDSGPAALTGSRSASFTYSADTAVAGWECRLDDAAFAPCPAGGKTYSDLSGGAHRFELRARDAAGNVDPTAAVHTWTTDLEAPATRIVDAPDAYSEETDATFAFAAADTGGSSVAGVECRLDGGAFTPCASPVRFTGLGAGRHTFEVRATDALGNVERAPAAHTWEIGSVFAIDDEVSTREDAPLEIDVLDNDINLATGPVAMTLAGAGSAEGGSVTAAGAGTVRYTPPADFNGTDRFEYMLSGDGDVSTGSVTVRVDAVNDAPAFAPGGTVEVDEDSGAYSAAWAPGVTAGPADESGQALRFAVEEVSNRALFSVQPALSAAGVLTFTPAPDASGSAAVQIRLVDDGGGRDASPPVMLQVTVRPVNDAPTIAVVDARRCDGGSGTLGLRVHDVDSATVTASASSRRVRVALAGAGPVRTLRLTGLTSGLRAAAWLRVTDGSLSSSLRIGISVGTRRGETLTGRRGPDLLLGLGGRDRIRGRGGNDVVCGGAGRDTLAGGPGADLLRGGRGGDLFADLGAGDRALDLSRRRGDRRGRS